MKALLTGASSFSGLWFVRPLAERGGEVIAPVRGAASAYSGVRRQRVRALEKVATVVPQSSSVRRSFLRCSIVRNATSSATTLHASWIIEALTSTSISLWLKTRVASKPSASGQPREPVPPSS
jgi:hypothetical protein